MSRISNCLMMLKLLQSGKKYNITELSEKLEVTPRMIKKYKVDLEEAGYYIESIVGRYGGYILKQFNKATIPNFSLYELECLEKIYKSLIRDSALEKTDNLMLINIIEKMRLLTVYQSDSKVTDSDKLEKLVKQLSKHIANKSEITIRYTKNNTTRKRKVIPINIYYFNERYFLTCHQNIDETRTFDLNNIIEILEKD